MNAAIRAILLGGGITSSDSDVTAWIAAVGPSNTTQAEVTALTTCFAGIKSDNGVSSLNQVFDRIGILGLGKSAAAVVEFAARSSSTLVNSPTFTPNVGFTGDGSTSYINTGYAASTATNATQNGNSHGVWAQTMDSRNTLSVMLGGQSAAPASTTSMCKFSTTQMLFANNITAAGSSNQSTTPSVGLWHGERNAASGATATNLWQNGAKINDFNTTSIGLESVNVFLLGHNNNGTPQLWTNATNSSWYMGKNLGATQIANLYARLHTLHQTLGGAGLFP